MLCRIVIPSGSKIYLVLGDLEFVESFMDKIKKCKIDGIGFGYIAITG